jgi:hypothetical protein
MIAALVCREFGWDWQTYQEQSKWFIDIVLSMLREETEEGNRKNKK